MITAAPQIPKTALVEGLIAKTIDWMLYFSGVNSWIQSSIARTSGIYSVLEFGAVGDSVASKKTDNTKAFGDAIDKIKSNKGGKLWIPPAKGSYYLGDRWLLQDCFGVDICGVGKSFDFTGGYQPGGLVFDGAGHGIKVVNGQFLGLRNLTVNGSLTTNRCVDVDQLYQSKWDSVSAVNAAVTGFRIRDSSGVKEAQFNKFSLLNTEVCPVGIELSGTPTSGVYHCEFSNCRTDYNGEAGVLLVNCDNVVFTGTTFAYRESGAGHAVQWKDDGSGNLPVQIDFQHLEMAGAAPGSTVLFDAACHYPGRMLLDLSNGGAFPAIPSGLSAVIETCGINSVGFYTSQIFPGTPVGQTQTGIALTAGTGEPNNADGAPNGWIYFRSDGGAGTTVYQKRGGVYVGIL